MKNIHLLPTDQPSRLHYDHSGLFLSKNFQLSETINSIVVGRNIYITSDKKPKDSDYAIYLAGFIVQKVQLGINVSNLKAHKKIILTTDQDLIKDGVQAIDDNFLEWFVKNPSCEFVEIKKEKQHIGEEIDESYPKGFFDYKIIIPKLDPKQKTLKEQFKVKILSFLSDNMKEQNSIECIKIANDFAIGFGEFLRQNYYDTVSKWHKEPDEDYTTEELIEIYKKKNGL